MATSFAAYASQFLTKQQNQSPSSSQPLFFSFTTDDGSRGGHDTDTDLDDLDDPHLRVSDPHTSIHRQTPITSHDQVDDDNDDDPYLRLDEEEPSARPHSHHIPFISPQHSVSSGSLSPRGWLAHQRQSRTPSPLPSPPPSDSPPNTRLSAPPLLAPAPPLVSRTPISLSLTDSLLPRDGHSRPIDVFSLPDPRHTPRGRRKHNDALWTAAWCAGVLICLLACFLLLLLARPPSAPPRAPLPYTTLLHTVPLLTVLTFLSAVVAYAHIMLLRVFVRPVVVATTLFVPATLLVSAVWAFVGSFMWDGDAEPTWGESVGLRLFSLVPLALAAFTARRLVDLPRQIHTASSTLTLTTRLLLANPFLLALSPTILLSALLLSLPFITLTFRLLLIGYFTHPASDAAVWEWHVRGWANWAIAGTVMVWLWSWGVARGVLRVTAAGVIGAWYFADPDALPPAPTSTHTIHSALFRATGPSLGTIALSALILTAIRLVSLLTLFLRRLPFYVPARVVVAAAGVGVRWLEGVGSALSGHALVYVGLTGDPFFVAARRGKALTEQRGRRVRGEPPLTLLAIAPLTLTFPFALATYLFVAHTLGAPREALGAAVLAGGVTALVGMFCVGLVDDTTDTLYICYCIDKDTGERRRGEVFDAFEYEGRSAQRRQQQQRGSANANANPIASRHQPPPTRSAKPKLQPLSPLPRALPDAEDIDPFEQSFMDEDIRALPAPAPAQERAAPGPVSPAGLGALSELRGLRSEMEDAGSVDMDGKGGGEGEEEMFPGSGLF